MNLVTSTRVPRIVRALLASAALATLGSAQAAVYTLHGSAAAWDAAAAGTILTQDFEGLASGTAMSGVPFLPGVSASTNAPSLAIFESPATLNNSLFATGGRAAGDLYYDITLSAGQSAVAFDITSFESVPGDGSTAVDTGLLTVFFADSTSVSFDIAGNLTGANIFFGIVADTAISSIRWAEAHEASGGNEETALDNFRVRSGTVPEPSTLALVGSVLALAGLSARRRQR